MRNHISIEKTGSNIVLILKGRIEYFRDRGFSVGEWLGEVSSFRLCTCRLITAPQPCMTICSDWKQSFMLAQQVLRDIDGKLFAEGNVKLVCVGQEIKPKRLPVENIQAIRE